MSAVAATSLIRALEKIKIGFSCTVQYIFICAQTFTKPLEEYIRPVCMYIVQYTYMIACLYYIIIQILIYDDGVKAEVLNHLWSGICKQSPLNKNSKVHTYITKYSIYMYSVVSTQFLIEINVQHFQCQIGTFLKVSNANVDNIYPYKIKSKFVNY